MKPIERPVEVLVAAPMRGEDVRDDPVTLDTIEVLQLKDEDPNTDPDGYLQAYRERLKSERAAPGRASDLQKSTTNNENCRSERFGQAKKVVRKGSNNVSVKGCACTIQ
jgi:hypothetical protein